MSGFGARGYVSGQTAFQKCYDMLQTIVDVVKRHVDRGDSLEKTLAESTLSWASTPNCYSRVIGTATGGVERAHDHGHV